MSKNWLADSKLPKCGVRRRIGKPLDRVSHDATAHRAVASPFLILYESKGFRVRRDATKGFAFGIHHLLKKAAENFLCTIFCETTFLTV